MVGAAHGLATEDYTIPYVASWASIVPGKTAVQVVQSTAERVRGAAVTIKPVWTGDFNDAAKAQQFATQLIGSGADVIVGSLNQGATGTFQAFEGKPSGSGWVTAKYTDKSAAAGPHYAGSLQYDFAKPLGDVLAKIAAGTRTGRYPLGFDTGVTISMSANVPADVKTAVTEVMDKIKSGQITVKLDTSKIG